MYTNVHLGPGFLAIIRRWPIYSGVAVKRVHYMRQLNDAQVCCTCMHRIGSAFVCVYNISHIFTIFTLYNEMFKLALANASRHVLLRSKVLEEVVCFYVTNVHISLLHSTRCSSWRLLMPLGMFCFAQKY